MSDHFHHGQEQDEDNDPIPYVERLPDGTRRYSWQPGGPSWGVYGEPNGDPSVIPDPPKPAPKQK